MLSKNPSSTTQTPTPASPSRISAPSYGKAIAVTSWESAIELLPVEETCGESWRSFKRILELAGNYNSPLVAMPLIPLLAAASRFAPSVRAIDPTTGRRIGLSLGIVAVGRHGQWHGSLRRLTGTLVREVTGQFPESGDTGGDEAGAIMALRKRVDGSRRRQIKEATSKFKDEEYTVEAIANMEITQEAEGLIPEHAMPSMTWIPHDLAALLHPLKPQLYHTLYAAIQQESISRLHRHEMIRVPPVTLNLFSCSTLESLQTIFQQGHHVKLLSRLLISYSTANPVGHNKRSGAVKEVLEFISNRIQSSVPSTTIEMTPDAKELFTKLRRFQGPGQLSQNMGAYQAERIDHLIRISALVALNRGSRDPMIEYQDLQVAEILLAGIEEHLPAVYLSIGMGIAGKVLALLGEAKILFDQTSDTLTYGSAMAWLTTSGIAMNQAKPILDQLTEAKLIDTDDHGGLYPLTALTTIRISASFKRIGFAVM